MSSSSKKTTVQDMFQGARDAFEQMISNLSGAGLTQATESEVETQTAKQGTDLLRLLIQGHLDLRTAREQLELIPVLKERGDAVRCRLRALETRFGRVSFSRAGVIDSGAAKGTPARFPLDEELNVPPELYSHPLRRCAAEEVRKASFDEGVEALDRSTGGHVPKRQIEQLTERAAQDFEVFYEQKKAQEPEDRAACCCSVPMREASACARTPSEMQHARLLRRRRTRMRRRLARGTQWLPRSCAITTSAWLR